MNINFKINNIIVNEEIKNYIQEKMDLLVVKYLSKLDEKTELQLDLEISRQMHHKKGNVIYTEANLEVPGKVLRASTYTTDIRTGIDEIEQDLKRQIKKYREIKESKTRKDRLKLKNFLRGIIK